MNLIAKGEFVFDTSMPGLVLFPRSHIFRMMSSIWRTGAEFTDKFGINYSVKATGLTLIRCVDQYDETHLFGRDELFEMLY